MFESPILKVENPDRVVEIDGQSFANLMAYLFEHRKNLGTAVEVLHTIDPEGLNEVADGLRGNLFGMGAGLDGVVAQMLRIASAQGLRFTLAGSPLVPTKFSN